MRLNEEQQEDTQVVSNRDKRERERERNKESEEEEVFGESVVEWIVSVFGLLLVVVVVVE